MSVCVIGAGIVGLTTAREIQRREPRAKIHIVANSFSPDTTSDISAGFWRPFYLEDPRRDLIQKWGSSTFKFMEGLYRDDAVKYGVGMLSGYELFEKDEEDFFWKDTVYNFRYARIEELRALGYGNYPRSIFYTTYYLESKIYLPVLQQTFCLNGGSIEKKHVNNLDELTNYDVIVNCSGLGSYHLVDDKLCYPIRGQVFKVELPTLKHFVCCGDAYLLLNHNVVTVGGTHQTNDWRTTIDPVDSKKIWSECIAVVPGLKNAKIIGEYAGLRPGRSCIRLEAEQRTLKNGQRVPVVHNYGHGGSGITLHYGCALDAAEMAVQSIHGRSLAKL